MTTAEVDVLVGGIRQMTSTVITSAGRCLLVDPGYFPREVADLEKVVQTRGSLKALAFTHGHWEHVMGAVHFADASVWVSEGLARDIEDLGEMSRNCLDEARRFDEHWLVQRPAPAQWPESLVGLSEGQRRRIGDITIEAYLVPGHSPDSMALVVEEAGVLIAGDYLSPCDIPIVHDFNDYYATLHRLADLLGKGINEVIPGHGWKMKAEDAGTIVREDLSYLYQIMFFRDSGDLQSARHMMLPRLNESEVIRNHHMENCRRLGLEEP